jgi:hypothetical protein
MVNHQNGTWSCDVIQVGNWEKRGGLNIVTTSLLLFDEFSLAQDVKAK